MKKRLLSILLSFVMVASLLPVTAIAADSASSAPVMMEFPLNQSHQVYSVGRYSNWAGVSSASQFIDEQGRFCFATEKDGLVTVSRTEHGKVVDKVSISNPYDSFGGAVCDSSGYLYLVWGDNNEGDDVTQNTIYVCKYTSDGKLVDSVGGNGSEGLDYYYGPNFYTKTPFEGGNCDIAINGNQLVVNYAREMYSGHQSNGIFTVDLSDMTVATGITNYNSHSFDQRVTPYGEDGFLLESLGDCYPRAFATAVTDASKSLSRVKYVMETFHFWVEEGAYGRWDMYQLNTTRARLGNILETSSGAALVAASARSLSENAKNEPYDVFVQVFDPTEDASDASAYITSGIRSGIAGRNGNENVTDYGVSWLTNLADTGKRLNEIQAVSLDSDTIAVFYELYQNGSFDSTWYLLLNGDGSVRQKAVNIGKVRLNQDEDPVYAQGAIQWVSNRPYSIDNTDTVYLNALFPASDFETPDDDFLSWTANRLQDVSESAYYFDAVAWALRSSVTSGTDDSHFSPNAHCTRAQIVTFLWRASGSPVVNYAMNLSDVSENAYYAEAVRWALSEGITSGTTKTTFSPNATCTRAQAVTFLYRASGSPAVSDSSTEFDDVAHSAYYANAVKWAATSGVTDGTGPDTFSPDNDCTRAQIVTFLHRAMIE